MSAFSIGGNLGFAFGPIVATPLVIWFGLAGGLLLAIPCLAIAVALVALTPFLRSFVPAADVRRAAGAGQDDYRALALLLGVIAFRSLAWFGLIAFVPLWEVSLGHSEAHGNHLLSLMLLAGGLGTIVAGPAADRFGRRPVLLVSVAASGPLIAVFVAVGGVIGALALCGVGICVIGTFGVTMVMSQEYLPRHIGMASGLSIGLDRSAASRPSGSVRSQTRSTCARRPRAAAAPVAGLLLALMLPSSRGRALEPEVAVPY
jgi:FSR family fosmidomycin resistance protein-like MFS transporter